MEVSTVSPPPALPTKGDNPCGIDVTKVAIDSVTLLICFCGLAGNGAVICVLGFHIRMNPITVYILDLAVINFLFLLFAVPSSLLFLLEDMSCSTIMSLAYLSFLFLLLLLFHNVGLYWLTAISIERCKSVLCPLCYCCHHPQFLPSGIVSAVLWALSIAVIAVTATATSLCQLHEQEHEHCRVALISTCTLNIVLFAPSVFISHTILIKAKCGSKQQQLQKLDIVLFLMVLFTLPLSLCDFLQQFGYTIMSSQVVFLLACITSTIKPFIYFLLGISWRHCSMESCWRHCSMASLRKALQRVFEEPEGNTACSNDVAMDMAVSAC